MQYFGQCYEICSRLDNAAALYSARVQYGIAKGHQFMGNFSALVTDCSASSLQKLVVWKDARVGSVQEAGQEEGATPELDVGEEEEEEGGGENQREKDGGEPEKEFEEAQGSITADGDEGKEEKGQNEPSSTSPTTEATAVEQPAT